MNKTKPFIIIIVGIVGILIPIVSKEFLVVFYVVYEGKCSCRTFPGQDRETIETYYKVIRDIITESGKIVKNIPKFLKKHPIKECKDIGNGIVFCNNATYQLNNYNLICTLPDNIEILEKEHDGLIKVNVLRDFCKLYVIVHRKRIIRYFKEQDFNDILDILNGDVPQYVKKRTRDNLPPDHVSPILTKSKYIEEIKDYYYRLEPKYNAYITNFPSIFSDVRMLRCIREYTGFFKEKGKWYRLDFDDLQNTVNKMIECYYPVRNFITGIKEVADIYFRRKKCKLYLFECKPYGYIDEKGYFQYDFDINNIQWY